MRSQPMFGLTTTMSPREMKRFMPPSASTARRVEGGCIGLVFGDHQLGKLECARRLQAKVAHLPNALGAVDVDSPVIPAQRPRPAAPAKVRPAAPRR